MGHTDDTMRAIGKIILIIGRMATRTMTHPGGTVPMSKVVAETVECGIAKRQNTYRFLRAMHRMQLIEETRDGFEYADKRPTYIRLTEHGLADYRDQTATIAGTGPTAA